MNWRNYIFYQLYTRWGIIKRKKTKYMFMPITPMSLWWQKFIMSIIETSKFFSCQSFGLYKAIFQKINFCCWTWSFKKTTSVVFCLSWNTETIAYCLVSGSYKYINISSRKPSHLISIFTQSNYCKGLLRFNF